MKRTILVLVLIFMFVGAGLFAQSGTIRELTGSVELKHAGARDFSDANVGDRLNQDTIISTGFRSTALVQVGSTVITVRPLTRLTLTEISAAAGEETINVSLQTGRVRVEVSPPAGTRANMSISSPNSTASVRGTSFSFDGRNVSVSEGTVSFQGNRGLQVPVAAGFVSGVSGDGSAANSVYTNVKSDDTSIAVANADSQFVPEVSPGADAASGTGSAGTATVRPVDVGIGIVY